MPETLTADTDTTIDLENLPGLEPARRSCEYVSLFVKIIGTMWLTSTTLGATGDLSTSLFVGVGYSTTLVCVTVLPLIRTNKACLKSQIKSQ